MIGCDDISSVAVIVADLANPKSRISVPLRLHDQIKGVLCLEQSGLRSIPDEDIVLLKNVASLISTAFDKFRILPLSNRANDYMQAILKAAQDVAILSTDVNGYVLMASEGTQSIFRITPQEMVGRDVLVLFSDPAFRQEVAEHLGSFSSAPPLRRNRLAQSSEGIESYLDVTMREACDSQNYPFGMLFIVTDVTQSVLLQRRLEVLANTDDLTGLYNQRRFTADLMSEIERSRRFQRTCSLAFVDIDGLRRANNARGHRAGDQILREAASLLRGQARANAGSCYRYGGDEFTILLPEATKQTAKIMLEQMREQLKEHFRGEITASIGIAEWAGSMEPEDLIEAADRAMYSAKSSGGNCTELASC
jgi:diguanylate cyclase (GGDEF)-like protein/PAS domain S-box-containing protein